VFDHCEKINRTCAFCTKANERHERWKKGLEEVYYCGLATSINRIDWMKKCPLPEIKKRSKLSSKKMGL